MEFSDKTFQCKQCGNDFIFTAKEQEFYSQKGFQNEPQRCKPCRDQRKQNSPRGGGKGRGGGGGFSRGGDRGPRPSFDAVCSTCGVQTSVPFKPDPNKPIYCRDCFKKNRPF